jgi:hypothetical protein
MLSTPTTEHGARLAEELLRSSGPFLSAGTLWRVLGFPSSGAFRQAKARGRLGVKVFKLPKRRGTFAYTDDVANWLRALDTEAPM